MLIHIQYLMRQYILQRKYLQSNHRSILIYISYLQDLCILLLLFLELSQFYKSSKSDICHFVSCFFRVPLFHTSSICDSIEFSDQTSNKLFSLLTYFSPFSGVQWPGVENEKLLFSSVIIKTEFVASKLVTANNHFPTSARFIGGLDEKVSICLIITNLRVSWSRVCVCWISVSVSFLIKKKQFIIHSSIWNLSAVM